MPLELRDILKKYWGYDTFRPLQEAAARSVLEGNDTLVLMPTGGGKSVCFQVPVMATEGMCVVVTPLISLMKDQVAHLKHRGIAAACLESGMSGYEIDVVLNNSMSGMYKFLYVSPERLKSALFIERYKRMKVSLIVVDEAHCISQWGYDFRPPYLEIVRIREITPRVPVMALTATATPEVADDIQRLLGFKRQCCLKTSFARDNLAYMVLKEEDKAGRLLTILRKTGGSSIVYARSRRRVYEVARTLQANGVEVDYYHAGLSAKERDERQRRWMKASGRCMVATNAFGMGIDKPDVRCVVHLDIPDSMEAYFQEAGRAGRDGGKSYAVLLYDEGDIDNLRYQTEADFPPISFIKNVYRAVCNFYQIPVGSGGGQHYDFDANAVCNTYGFDLLQFHRATGFLQREGLLDFPDDGYDVSTLYVPVSQEDLYRFQVENKRYGDIIAVILRMYGGLFTDFVPISEHEIARRFYLSTEDSVIAALQRLDKAGMVVYRKKSDRPQVVFVQPRQDADHIAISEHNYAFLKERAVQRMETMINYVRATDGCRSEMLRSYFGDTADEPCGRCDLCLLRGQR
ncbi:MAG: RecQ family ATP-dependent DNA helicase [Bacteroidales bacterium]|nr:RecQ family ATP-dependent DNA helicase [Bacteroidales bacterium]